MSENRKFDAVVFDLDGTLVEAKEWHYLALNEALNIFGEEISLEEHISTFDGLPTKRKLTMLSNLGRLPLQAHDIVSAVKQERTIRFISAGLFPSVRQLLLFQWLKAKNYKIGVATNSIAQSAETMLAKAGLLDFLDALSTNEDVSNPKPDPAIYISVCQKLGVTPGRVLAVEDNAYGVASAESAGCKCIEISSVSDLDTVFLSRHMQDESYV